MATSTTEPPIGISALAYYIKRICAFLESDKKTISFPNISPQLRNVLVNFVKISSENTDFLTSDEFSKNVNVEAKKLAAAIKSNTNFKLSHEICDGKHGKNVLMYKKTEVTFKAPQPLRRPNFMSHAVEPPSDGTLTAVFKTQCLNAATKFVKDDSQLVMRFPEVAAAQAEFIMDMIQPGTNDNSEKADIGFGFRSMYAPLWESMRVNSLKYKYRLEYDPGPVTKDGLKKVVFEKIPKDMKIEPSDLKSSKTPQLIINLDDEDIDGQSSSSASLNNTLNSKPKKKALKENQPQHKQKVDNLIRKLGVELQNDVLKQFVNDALRRIAEFVLDDKQKSISFEKTSPPQQYFLDNVRRLSANPASYMLFSSVCQKYLDDIKYCTNVKYVKYRVKYGKEVFKNEEGVALKTLELEKISSSDVPDIIDLEASEPLNLSFSSKSSTSVGSHNSSLHIVSSESQNQNLSKKLAEFENKLKKKVQAKAEIENKPKEKNRAETEIENNLTTKNQAELEIENKLKKNVRAGMETEKKLTKKNQKIVDQLKSKQSTGPLSEKFIEETLQGICDFMCDVEQASIVFRPKDQHQAHFIQKVGQLAREEETYRAFTDQSQKLLAKINRCFKNKTMYQSKKGKGRNDLILEKLPNYNSRSETQDTLNTPENLSVPLTQKEQDLLIRLKAIKDAVENTCGDIAFTYYLQDIAYFLTKSNTARSITFEEVSESEATFLKHVHKISKLPAAHALLPTNCLTLLTSVRDNAKAYKLKFKMTAEDLTDGLWKVTIQKQPLAANENKGKMGSQSKQHNSIEDLYLNYSQILDGKDQMVQQKATSLAPAARSGSSQRLSSKDQLKAGLAQPVQADKAVRMMESMGWKGGALGLRGEGITEPISLSLDLATRAGLGHVPSSKKTKDPKPKKPPPPKQGPSNAKLPPSYMPTSALPGDVLTPGVPAKRLQDKICKTIFLDTDYHVTLLKNILEIISSDVDEMHFISRKKTHLKIIGFLKHAVVCFNGRHRLNLDDDVQKRLVAQISQVFEKQRDLELNAAIRDNVMLLEKCIISNNDSTNNRTDSVTTKEKGNTKSALSLRSENGGANSVTAKKQNESVNNDAPMINNVAPIGDNSAPVINKPTPIINKSAPVINDSGPIINKSAPVINDSGPIINESAPVINNSGSIINKSAPDINNSGPIINKSAPVTNNATPIINNAAPIINKPPLNIDNLTRTTDIAPVTNRSLIKCRSEKDLIGTRVDEKITATEKKDMNQNDTNSVTYIVPVKSEVVTENTPNNNTETKLGKDTAKIENNRDMKGNRDNNNIKNNHNDEVFNDSTPSIMINIDDEILLISDDEKDISKVTYNLTKEKTTTEKAIQEKNTIMNESKENTTTRNVVEATPNGNKKPHEVKKEVNDTGKESDHCDNPKDIVNQPAPIQERKRRSFDSPKRIPKKSKLLTDCMKVSIILQKDPMSKLSGEKAREIQTAILKSIDYKQNSLPLLKCQGIRNGGLIYNCQDKKSLSFLENLIQNMDDLKIVYEVSEENQLGNKMALRINNYVDESVFEVLKRLELYNSGLSCKKWQLIKMEQIEDVTVIYAVVDVNSYNYICEANFVLYAGNDCARFTIVWD